MITRTAQAVPDTGSHTDPACVSRNTAWIGGEGGHMDLRRVTGYLAHTLLALHWLWVLTRTAPVLRRGCRDRPLRLRLTLLRTAALGWTAALAYEDGVLGIDMRDKNSEAIRDAIVIAKIGHPVQNRDDQTVTLIARGGAHYAADLVLTPGIWDAELTVTGPKGEIWTHGIRFMVKG